MSFKRVFLPETFQTGEALTSDLIGIGFRLSGKKPAIEPNIEDTLIAATIEGMEGDFRVLSLLVDWIDVHRERINVDRITRMIFELKDKKLTIFWAGVAGWLIKDIRFKRLAALAPKLRYNLLSDETNFLIKRNGEDERFIGTCLRVPNKTLRQRKDDIRSQSELIKLHRRYYYRVLIGATYRADMFAILEINPNISPSGLARLAYCSFRVAWEVKKDGEILKLSA